MEFYPQDLLVGVHPLIFAVDATLPSDRNAEHSPQKRTIFDRFLDAVAASLIDVDDNNEIDNSNDRRRSVSLFRPDEDESSDEDDFEIFGNSPRRKSANALSAGFYTGFGRRSLLSNSSSPVNGLDDSTGKRASYAKALTHGQGFFSRARIEAVGVNHGFPPSKDPDGTANLAYALPLFLKERDPQKLANLFQSHPISGILPAGWLEKHVHALPSVILVICTVSSSQTLQKKQDKRLLDTIEHLKINLVPKRQCTIYVIGLIQDDMEVSQGDAWTVAITNHMLGEESGPVSDPPFRVTLLRESEDLQANDTGMPTSQALRRLHHTVRDTSMMYYLSQARRTKDKLAKLTEDKRRRGQESPPRQLLPLVIRYCFKLAIFYEFQWKHEKSLRFFVEAYRHAMDYYQYLLDLATDHPTSSNGEDTLAPHSVADNGESFEVALSENSLHGKIPWGSIVPPSPIDMIHQCRAVAEWLNLKLLSAGFISHTEGGLLAAAHQWRQHCRLFATRRNSSALAMPDWFEWSYIARQRLILSQLVERHPPKALGDLGNEYDDVLLRCSPWRAYESAVEATLCLARELDEAKVLTTTNDVLETNEPRRARYVGGIGSEGLPPILRELAKVDHRGKALERVLRSISLFERESEKEKRGFFAEDSFEENSSSRSGARLYYLAGGILLGMNRHLEAADHLQKASKFSKGWRGLELAVRKMLIECYETHMPPSETSEGSNEAIASMILDSYFNAQMSTVDLRRALGHFASIIGGNSLKWLHEVVDEEDSKLPFSFAVSFPGTTHATAGDRVKASVLITSNLDYAVHVNSVTLLSLAGQLPVLPVDLLSATNASEGSDGGIIIQSKTSIIVSTEIELPKDTSIIAVDDSGNGGENQGVAGKGSFSKSARPRTAGITAAGGARLVSEEEGVSASRLNQGWSLRCLGGKPLRCDGLKVVFFPVQAGKTFGSAETTTLIELTIQKKKPKTAANIKRTPFEEENYIASAWSRPINLPLSRGPRSLRVLGPLPELLVEDVTAAVTGGKALEGTVNRILLKATAGCGERCCDIKFNVSCFSVLVTPEGSTRRLVSSQEVAMEPDSSLDMNDSTCRTPTLVTVGGHASKNTQTDFGYALPDGYIIAGDGHSFSIPTWPQLQNGESTFIQIDLFRPPPLLQNASSFSNIENFGDTCVCKTDFYVNISYRQQRLGAQKLKRSGTRQIARRRRTAPKVDFDAALTGEPNGKALEQKTAEIKDEDNSKASFDEVTLEYSGSVVWEKPLAAKFSSGAKMCGPCGNRYEPRNSEAGDTKVAEERMCLSEGECITTNCSLETDNAVQSLSTEIYGISYDDVADGSSDSCTTLYLQGGQLDANRLLYRPTPDDPCRILSSGHKLSVACTVKASFHPSFSGTEAKTPIGIIAVDWKPCPLPLPDKAKAFATNLGNNFSHGPLHLKSPSRIRFEGPSVFVQRSPFEATLTSILAPPRVGKPFEVTYSIRNKTELSQSVHVELIDPGNETNFISMSLVCTGLLNGEVVLGPLETQTITYTIHVNRAGKLILPSLHLLSKRYKSWIIKEASPKELYVLP